PPPPPPCPYTTLFRSCPAVRQDLRNWCKYLPGTFSADRSDSLPASVLWWEPPVRESDRISQKPCQTPLLSGLLSGALSDNMHHKDRKSTRLNSSHVSI